MLALFYFVVIFGQILLEILIFGELEVFLGDSDVVSFNWCEFATVSS